MIDMRPYALAVELLIGLPLAAYLTYKAIQAVRRVVGYNRRRG